MSDVVSRLLAAIDERAAKARDEGHYDPDEGGYYACPATRSEPLGDLPFGEDACDCGLAERRADTLRLCQAHRDIVAEWQKWRGQCSTERQLGYFGGLDLTIRLVARGYGVEDGED